MSTARITEARIGIIYSAAAAAAIALCLGVLAAWLIARSIARRLRAIGSAATRVASGDLAEVTLSDHSADEIGTLATAFSSMVQQIRELVVSREEQARLEHSRLESLVLERTRELASRNRDLAFVLENVDQGIFLVDLDGRIASQRSAAVERLLGPVPADGMLGSYVMQFDLEAAAWFDVCWAALRDDLLPADLALSQIQRRFEIAGRQIELDYQVVDADGVAKVLIVATDISARIARELAERDQQELSSLVLQLLADRTGYLEFHAEMELRTNAMQTTDLVQLRREAHTLKGTAAVFGVTSIAELCHTLEERLDDIDAATTQDLIGRIVARWTELTHRLQPFTASRADHVEISRGELDQLIEDLRGLTGGEAVIRTIESWRHEPVRARLERLAGHIRALSTSLGKGPVSVQIESDQSRIAPERWSHVWGALVHVVRNAVDHGLESPEERAALGKPREAEISLRAAVRSSDLVIEVEDAGRGIDWSQVATAASHAGLPSATSDDLVRALFADGLSTRTSASMTSGRGVGLAAAHQACIAAGGQMHVNSRPGLGTCFTFVLPAFESPTAFTPGDSP